MKKFFKKHWKKFVFLLILIGIIFVSWRFFAKPLIAKIKGEVIDKNEIEEVKKGNIEIVFNASGKITAKQDIKITTKPSGILKELYVKEGDSVKKGQKVALIKPGRNEFEDYKPMPIYSEASGMVVRCVGEDDYRKNISDRDLSLPHIGTFLTGSYDNAVNPTCLLRVVDMNTLLISSYVTENQIVKLQTGMPVDITIRALGDEASKIKGKISYVASQSEKLDNWGDNIGFLIIVELENLNKKIPLGVSAEMNIVIDKKENVLTIPASALFERDGKNYVFKYLGNNKTEQAEIETGLQNNTQIEIIKGLKEGDKILTALPYGESW